MKSIIRNYAVVIMIATAIQPFTSLSQGKSTFLKIGDKVPDLAFPIKNYKTTKAKISDFKGKLVILDLWATYCSSCIEAMPKMEALQKKFDGKLQVIMATKDNDASIAKLAIRSDNVRNNKLPSITADKILSPLFNYTYLPTHVWIDQSGVVRFITGGSGANEKNIEAFLEGKNINLREKIDLQLNRDEPMMVRWYPYYKELSLSTFLAPTQKKYSTGGIKGQRKSKQGYIERIFSDLESVSGLYKLAFGLGIKGDQFSETRVIFTGTSALKYKYDPTKDYRDSTAGPTFMYELINKNKIPDKRIYSFMQAQFDMVFGLKSSWQKREVDCYVLRSHPSGLAVATKGGAVKGEWHGDVYSLHNVPWRNFMETISNITASPLQIIDETGVIPSTKVDVSVDLDWSDIGKLNTSLLPYGLSVSKEKRVLDCIVLEDSQ